MFPGFDRHALLVRKYTKQIEGWDWAGLLRGLELHKDEEGEPRLTNWLGTFRIKPSGKFYTCWTTNQTDHDVQRDEAWWEALEEVAEKHGGYIDSHDDSIYFAKQASIICSTWFERDRSHVRVYEEHTDTELLDLWDEEVQQELDGGFLDRRDLEGSAIEHALEQFGR